VVLCSACAGAQMVSQLCCCKHMYHITEYTSNPDNFVWVADVPCAGWSMCLLHAHCTCMCLAGNALATSGEDGQVKIWSKSGMLRSTLVEADDPVYCLAWGGSAGSQLLVCSGSNVSIRSAQGVASGPAAAAGSGIRGSRGNINSSSKAQVSWKAHEGIVLKADWSSVTGLIVTGGEDCRYKVSG
jgi:hypothetical protein